MVIGSVSPSVIGKPSLGLNASRPGWKRNASRRQDEKLLSYAMPAGVLVSDNMSRSWSVLISGPYILRYGMVEDGGQNQYVHARRSLATGWRRVRVDSSVNKSNTKYLTKYLTKYRESRDQPAKATFPEFTTNASNFSRLSPDQTVGYCWVLFWYLL